MKIKTFFLTTLTAFSLNVFSQTLYVPSGISGISSSSTANVGIGISNPSEKLQINGAIRGNVNGALKVSTGSGYIDLGPQNTSWAHIYTDRPNFIFNAPIYSMNGQFSSYSTNPLYLQTHGTTRMTIKNDGNIGVGCDPGSTTFKIYKANLPLFELSSSVSRLQIGIATCVGCYANGAKSGDEVLRTLGSFNNTILYIPNNNNDGNSYIGIGDDANAIWLKFFNNRTIRVNGTVIATKMIVKTDAWSDYVFDPDYKLKSLDEIETFIKDNKHLPDVPSANQVIEQGIDVAQMNAILLKKIEELTLLMIEQNKTIQSLQSKVNEIQK